MNFWTDKKLWRRSAFNTSICLLGCSIGDFGALIYFAIKAPETPMLTQMAVAIVAGITTSIMLETVVLRVRESFNWFAALKIAAGMSLISMIMMEIAMNLTDFYLRNAYNLTPADLAFWLSFIPALAIGFITPWPYNYWRLKALGKSCCAHKK